MTQDALVCYCVNVFAFYDVANFLRSLLLRYLTLKLAQQEVKFVTACAMKAYRVRE